MGNQIYDSLNLKIVSDDKPKIEVSEEGITIHPRFKKSEFVHIDKILYVFPRYEVMHSSYGMNMYLTLIFQLNDRKYFQARFTEEKVKIIYQIFSKHSIIDVENERKLITDDYNIMIQKYKNQIEFRNKLMIFCICFTFIFVFLFLPDRYDFSTKIFAGIGFGLIFSFLIILYFALLVGRSKYAVFRSILLRIALFNKYRIRNVDKQINIDKSLFEYYSKNTLGMAGIFLLGFGISILLISLYFLNTSFNHTIFFAVFGGVLCIIMGLKFIKSSKKLFEE